MVNDVCVCACCSHAQAFDECATNDGKRERVGFIPSTYLPAIRSFGFFFGHCPCIGDIFRVFTCSDVLWYCRLAALYFLLFARYYLCVRVPPPSANNNRNNFFQIDAHQMLYLIENPGAIDKHWKLKWHIKRRVYLEWIHITCTGCFGLKIHWGDVGRLWVFVSALSFEVECFPH